MFTPGQGCHSETPLAGPKNLAVFSGVLGTGYLTPLPCASGLRAGLLEFPNYASCPRNCWGHHWVVLAVGVQVAARAWVALPFWVALYRPKKTCPRGEFRTRHEMANPFSRRTCGVAAYVGLAPRVSPSGERHRGAQIELTVTFEAGRRHLPVVTLRRVA